MKEVRTIWPPGLFHFTPKKLVPRMGFDPMISTLKG